MLKIRLKRTGKIHEPHYRIVVTQSTRARDSKAIAEIGYYNPRTQPSTLKLDKEAAKSWLSKGAQPTGTIEQIFVKQGLIAKIKRGSTQSKGAQKKKAAKA